MAVKIQTARDFCFRKPLLAEPSARLCRNLFGKVDKDDLQDDYNTSLKKETTEKSKLWDFDFVSGAPLSSSRLRWEPVTKGAASIGTGADSSSCTLSSTRPTVTESSSTNDVSTHDKIEEKPTPSASLRIIHEEELTTEGCRKTATRTSPPRSKATTKVEKRKRETTITEFMKQKKKRRYSDIEKNLKPTSGMEPARARTRLSVSEF